MVTAEDGSGKIKQITIHCCNYSHMLLKSPKHSYVSHLERTDRKEIYRCTCQISAIEIQEYRIRINNNQSIVIQIYPLSTICIMIRIINLLLW